MESGEYGENGESSPSQYNVNRISNLGTSIADAMKTYYNEDLNSTQQCYNSLINKKSEYSKKLSDLGNKLHSGKKSVSINLLNKSIKSVKTDKIKKVTERLKNTSKKLENVKTSIKTSEDISEESQTNWDESMEEENISTETDSNKNMDLELEDQDNLEINEPIKEISQNNDINKNSYNNKYKNLTYSNSDIAPFIIYVESENINNGVVHQMAIGKLMFKNFPQYKHDIIEIKSIGKNRIKIIFNNYNIANNIIKDEVFVKNKLRAYIPTFLLIRKGVIHGIDTDMTDQEIREDIKSDVEILDLKRINKKENNKLVPTKTCVITFRGQQLPDRVSIYAVKFRVEQYNNITQCFNCQNYGHVTNQCKGKTRCSHCSGEHKYKDCENKETSPTCALCKEEHQAKDKKCGKYLYHIKVKNIMTDYNISFREAKAILNNKTYADVMRPDVEIKNKINFPDLPDVQIEKYTKLYQQPEIIRPTTTVPKSTYKNNNNISSTNHSNVNKITGDPPSAQERNRYKNNYHNTTQKPIIHDRSEKNEIPRDKQTILKIEERHRRRNVKEYYDRRREINKDDTEWKTQNNQEDNDSDNEENKKMMNRYFREIFNKVQTRLRHKTNEKTEKLWTALEEEIDSLCIGKTTHSEITETDKGKENTVIK